MAKARRKQMIRLQERRNDFDSMPHSNKSFTTPKEQSEYTRPGSMNSHKSHSIRKGKR